MTILYFTATGNSLQIAKALGGELISIPQLLRSGKFIIEDDVIGIVCPVFSINIPRIVTRFLSKAKFKADYIFGVLTYGSMSVNASGTLEKLLSLNGNRIDYIKEIIMTDNFLPMFNMESQLEKLPGKNVDSQIQALLADVSAKKYFIPKKNIFFKLLTSMMDSTKSEKGNHKIDNTDKSFIVNERCNQCGICAKVCPADNIVIEDKPKYQHHCETCYACIHNCPQNAIHIKCEKSSARFRNNTIKLEEIIQSNSKK